MPRVKRFLFPAGQKQFPWPSAYVNCNSLAALQPTTHKLLEIILHRGNYSPASRVCKSIRPRFKSLPAFLIIRNILRTATHSSIPPFRLGEKKQVKKRHDKTDDYNNIKINLTLTCIIFHHKNCRNDHNNSAHQTHCKTSQPQTRQAGLRK